MFSMIERKGSFYLGVFVFIIPFLGFPTMWKMILVVVGGVLLILTSLKVPTVRKNWRPKVKKEEFVSEVPEVKKEEVKLVEKPVEQFVPSTPVFDAPIIKIDREVKKTRKPRVKSDSAKKLDIKF
jgi:hypothetical protein